MAHSKSHAKHLKKRKQQAAQMANILFGYSGDRHLSPGSLERRNQKAVEANEVFRKIIGDKVDDLLTKELHELGTNEVTCLPLEWRQKDVELANAMKQAQEDFPNPFRIPKQLLEP